jgi:hypothetical protein
VSPALGLRWLGSAGALAPAAGTRTSGLPEPTCKTDTNKIAHFCIYRVNLGRAVSTSGQGYEKHRDTVFGRPAPLRSSSLPRSCIGPPGGEATADGRQEGRDAAADRRDAAGSSFRQGSRAVGQGGARRDSGRQARSREDEERDACVSKKTGTRRCIASGAAPSIATT